MAIPDTLIAACASRRAVLVAGMGLGTYAGYPSWRELLAALVKAGSRKRRELDWRSVRHELGLGHYSLVADILAGRLERPFLTAELNRQFSRRKRNPPAILRDLSRIPFDNVISTAWDRSLEDAFAGESPITVAPASKDVPQLMRGEGAFCIVRLSGLLPNSTNPGTPYYITSSEYQNALKENRDFTKQLTTLALTQTHVFVGISVSAIEAYLSSIAIRQPGQQTHFAFVVRSPSLALLEERFLGFGVQLISVPKAGRAVALSKAIAELSNAVVPRSQNQRAQRRPPYITKVSLTGIGPFANFSADLLHQWTVILGNNGCGKSTLLKAIGAALCVDDPRTQIAAAKLLRSSADSGSIEVTLAGQTFGATISKSSSTFIRSDVVSPIRAAGWLVLGFPGVRGVGSRSANPNVRDGSARPMFDDLLPLVIGQIDSRLQNLREWLVMLDVRSTAGGGVTESMAERNKQLVQSFFSFVNEFLPGAGLVFDHVDRTAWDVYVRTQDGVVSLDQISQGMLSVLNWVGTLLQRLYEIYPESPAPEQEPVIVLVDEIDAHLHAAWQQSLVDVLSKRFPNTQFIVATHSPFIVSALPSEATFRLARGANGVVELSRPQFAVEGWSVDQMLLDPLFGLQSTRASPTVLRVREYAALLQKGVATLSDTQSERLQALGKLLAVAAGISRRRLGEIASQAISGGDSSPKSNDSDSVLDAAVLRLLERMRDRNAV